MADFEPGTAFRSFRPEHAGRGRRRSNALHFVAQPTASGEARFVVKDYAAPGDTPEESRARLKRELDGQAAFVAQGEAVLWPCAGPFERLSLPVDGQVVAVGPSLVFPYLPAPTLFDVLRESSLARDGVRHGSRVGELVLASPLLTQVVSRIAARHARATSVADLHSDGAAHNILVMPRFAAPAPPSGAAPGSTPTSEPALLWFDFAEPHAAHDVAEARAIELLAFMLSVVEASRAGDEHARIAAVCAGYPDRAVLQTVLSLRMPERPQYHALRHRLRLRSWLQLWRGDTTQLARYRLLRALRLVLSEPRGRSRGGER